MNSNAKRKRYIPRTLKYHSTSLQDTQTVEIQYLHLETKKSQCSKSIGSFKFTPIAPTAALKIGRLIEKCHQQKTFQNAFRNHFYTRQTRLQENGFLSLKLKLSWYITSKLITLREEKLFCKRHIIGQAQVEHTNSLSPSKQNIFILTNG